MPSWLQRIIDFFFKPKKKKDIIMYYLKNDFDNVSNRFVNATGDRMFNVNMHTNKLEYVNTKKSPDDKDDINMDMEIDLEYILDFMYHLVTDPDDIETFLNESQRNVVKLGMIENILKHRHEIRTLRDLDRIVVAQFKELVARFEQADTIEKKIALMEDIHITRTAGIPRRVKHTMGKNAPDVLSQEEINALLCFGPLVEKDEPNTIKNSPPDMIDIILDDIDNVLKKVEETETRINERQKLLVKKCVIEEIVKNRQHLHTPEDITEAIIATYEKRLVHFIQADTLGRQIVLIEELYLHKKASLERITEIAKEVISPNGLSQEHINRLLGIMPEEENHK